MANPKSKKHSSENLELSDLPPPRAFRWKHFWNSLLTLRLESSFSAWFGVLRLMASIEILLIASLIISAVSAAPDLTLLIMNTAFGISLALTSMIEVAAFTIAAVVLPYLSSFSGKEWVKEWAPEHKGELIMLGIACLLAIGMAIFCIGFAAGNPAFDFQFMHTIYDFLSTGFSSPMLIFIFPPLPVIVTLAASGTISTINKLREAINAGYGIKSPEATRENTDQEDNPTENLEEKEVQNPTLSDSVFSDQNKEDEQNEENEQKHERREDEYFPGVK